jgi:hypothetical protein
MAISEFAPGSQVVAAKRIWQSAGVRKYPSQDWEPVAYAVCPKCDRMTIRYGQDKPESCACGNPLVDLRYKGIFIVPEHGFVASQKTTSPGEKSPDVFYSSQVYFSNYDKDPLIPNGGASPEDMEPVRDEKFINSKIPVRKKYSRFGWLALVNDGRRVGFNICNSCGSTKPVVVDSTWGEHDNPLSGRKCNGGYSHYHFGHRFMTDVLEIQLDYNFANRSEIQSVLYAILVGASEALGIRREDLNGTIYSRGGTPAFVIYDNVPGGAGHVARVSDHLYEVFTEAWKVVSNCKCGEDTSCYGCLRNYNNQFHHDDLVRGLAAIIIAQTLEK